MNYIKQVLVFIGILWGVLFLDFIIPLDFAKLGIMPRSIGGLVGVVFHPFLHGSLGHLASNTIPVLVLLSVLYNFYTRVATRVVIYSVLISGVLVWLFGRSAYHIGASGLIYSIAAFLVAASFYNFNLKSFLIALIIIILYGGLVWGLLPVNPYISFEGHLFGAIAGIFLAWSFRNEQLE